MRSAFMKLLAIILATALLFAAAACGVGIAYMAAFELYDKEETVGDSFLEQMAYRLAWDYAQLEIAKQNGMQPEETAVLRAQNVPEIVENNVLEIHLAHGNHTRKDVRAFQFTITELEIPIVLEDGEEYPNHTFLREETRRMWVNGRYRNYTILYYQADWPVEVTVFWEVPDNPWLSVSSLCYDLQECLLLMAVSFLAVFALCIVYLCWAAGKKRGRQEIVPGGLNRIPLDLYGLVVCHMIALLLIVGHEGVISGLYGYYAMYTMALTLIICMGLVICLLPVCFLFAFAAQVKARGYWWRRSVIGWCCIRIFRAIRWCWHRIKAVLAMLPVIWQWLLTAAAMVLVPVLMQVFASAVSHRYDHFFVLLCFLALMLDVILVLYGGWCFGIILTAAKRMAAGDLDRKIDTRCLYGSFRHCAENLNTLSQAAMVAARKQMQSERMKTELITNVSHDIKTPLTSIINYVDLLRQSHSEEENEEYLEVLARQSQRLKKLTEDLVEMSKASTGNVSVELGEVDAGETVLQALGEFGDKLEAVPLSVVFPQPSMPVMMYCDGRLAWRVMSNLLGNAVKYAMPGTRLYVNVEQTGEWVVISFKNISRESLNISAEELMERFVRGDASRNTEGSGLGLNIAQSLMEVQGGSLELTVDGDLFKVTLSFLAA